MFCFLFNSNPRSLLQGQLSNGEWCVKAESADRVTIAWCEMGVVKGPWSFDETKRQMVHTEYNKCLAVHAESRALVLSSCDAQNLYHKWTWKEIIPHWAKRSRH